VRSFRGLTVALVGADGAGKSTLARLLRDADLPRPVETVYMGVNLEASTLMLPTTRLLLSAKRRRGGRPDLVATDLGGHPGAPTGPGARARRPARELARFAVWSTEEWLRQAVALVLSARGRIVVFDRHFVADYWHADAAAGGVGEPRRGTASRAHGWLLRNLYPRPDLTLCLDAPAEVLYARKPEAPVAWLEDRRRQYLALDSVVPRFVVLDAVRPIEAVLAEAVDVIAAEWKARRA
jgi:thymidylate kinase